VTGTLSDHAALPAEEREPLLAAIESAIDGVGGRVELELGAELFLARVAATEAAPRVG